MFIYKYVKDKINGNIDDTVDWYVDISVGAKLVEIIIPG